MAFGRSLAPEIFEERLDRAIEGLDGVFAVRAQKIRAQSRILRPRVRDLRPKILPSVVASLRLKIVVGAQLCNRKKILCNQARAGP